MLIIKKNKKVVITGCLGFIGGYLTEAILKRGWQVYGIDNCTYAANLFLIGKFKKFKSFNFVKEDIAQIEYIPDCDCIINVAAESHVANSILNSNKFIDSNIVGVKNILDILRNKLSVVGNKPLFFQFSTDEVYGDIIDGSNFETDTLNPSNPYSASKASADMFMLAWARTYGLPYIIFRPTNNYGLRQHEEKLIPLVINSLKRGSRTYLHNKGMPIRNWLHVKDTVAAVLCILDNNIQNQIFNVSAGYEQKNIDTVRKIINCFFNGSVSEKYKEWKNLIDFSYVRDGQDMRYSLNCDKLKNLGWQPKRIFDVEIEKIVKYYKNNG